MLTILKSVDGGLEVLDEVQEGSWIHLLNPTDEVIESLSEKLNIPPDFLTSPLDPDESARTEKDDEVILVVLRIPHFERDESDIPYITIPLGIILAPHHIITICKWKNPIIDTFLYGGRRGAGISTAKKYRFILQILLRTAREYLVCLRVIDHEVDVLEDRLQVSLRNKELLDILKYQKSLTYFTTALKANELMMERLQRGRLFHMYHEDEELLEDVLTEIRQAIEMVNISANILNQMMDTFASIINNNLNMVMKILALVTIVLSLPTLVASVFGMNVALPFQESPYAFLITMIIAFSLSATVVAFFRHKRWF